MSIIPIAPISLPSINQPYPIENLGLNGTQGLAFNPLLTNISAPLAEATTSTLSLGTQTNWGGLQHLISNINNKQITANEKVLDVLNGGPTPVHEAMVATEEANLSFELITEMRNKVVEAYQQIMQMQV